METIIFTLLIVVFSISFVLLYISNVTKSKIIVLLKDEVFGVIKERNNLLTLYKESSYLQKQYFKYIGNQKKEINFLKINLFKVKNENSRVKKLNNELHQKLNKHPSKKHRRMSRKPKHANSLSQIGGESQE